MKSGKRSAIPRVRSLALALQAAWGITAFALPDGAVVVNGQVQITQPAAGVMRLDTSHGAIINWRQFSIGAGESAQFVQPSSTSAVLNRVLGRESSNLLGQLTSNGQVFLINPNGITIGAAARIDTNSFIASTLDLADADFLAGKLRFAAQPGAGTIRNEGLISAGPGGRIALIAPDIENSGIIHAPDGNILLAAGRKLEIASMDMEGVRFEIQAPTDSVLNLGKLLAENGAVRVFAGSIRHSGEAIANRMAVDADGSIVLSGRNDVTLTADSLTRADGASGGTVLVQSAEGTTRVQGLVSAAGTAGSGGDIRILGERVALDSNARIVASGSSAGGQILVGGDYQGANTGVQNAARVFVGGGVRLEADATDDGDGGRVIVWADENTRFAGSLSARGGPNGGDGGFAEVSGKQNLEFTGAADLRAAHGASGTLLLDPLDILVSLNSGILPIVVDEFADFSGNVVTISPLTLAAVGGNVVLQAERDIYVRDAITLTTGGAGLSMTAGGVLFDAGSIFNTAGITTNGGAVTLRAQSVSGPGTITTAGGAVDVLTTGTLNYSSAIASGGGAVTLASNSSVSNANVDAGSGSILVNGTSISSGSYLTTGTAAFTASAGNISLNSLNANVVSLTATSSINATISAGQRIDAASTGSSVSLRSSADAPLRLGTVSGNSGVFLTSSTGMEQAAGGVLVAPRIDFNTNGSITPAGSQTAPLTVASPSAMVEPEINVFNLAAPIHLAFSGSPTLSGLSFDGSVAAIGSSTVAFGGTANLSALDFGSSTGVLTVSASATGGFTRGFEINVNDGAINAPLLTFPGAPVDLTAAGAVTVGTMTGGSLSVQARGAVSIDSATTTGSFGINVFTQSCIRGTTACLNQSPITAGTLVAGGFGDIDLSTFDNGDISVTSLTAGDRIDIYAGERYRTSPFSANYTDQVTDNNILLGTVVSGGRTNITNVGQGNLTVASLSSGNRVDLRAGTSFTPVAFTSLKTSNTITVGNLDPVGAVDDFRVTNNGIGDITVTGAVDRSNSGDITLSAGEGSVTALGTLTARDTISVTASGTGAATLGQLISGTVNSNGNVTVSAAGNLSFGSIDATAVNVNSGNVSLTSSTGSVTTTQDNLANDISATGNVTIQAGMAIGDGMAARPMDILAGASRSVSLTAGTHIGAALKPVNIDTSGTAQITSTAGQFHVAATDGAAERSLSTIRLSASAAGIGNGNASTFTSADLDLDADSDGAIITIGDPITGNLVRSAGTLNEFSFTASGTSGLVFGDVNLTTAGLNQIVLNATNGLTQTSPLTNGITAGTANLTGGAGAVEFGAVMARSLRASGAGLSTRGITTTGINRSTSGATPDTLTLSSSAGILVTGDLSSATVIDVNSGGGDLTVTGAVTGTGASRNVFNAAADQVRLQASGNIATDGAVTSLTSTRVIAGGSVTVGGAGIDGGTAASGFTTLSDTVTVTAGTANAITTQAITDGFSKTITGGTLNIAGGVSGAASSTVINGTTFNTGNLATSGALTINATGAYAPNAIALSATGSVTINAPDGIDLQSGQSSLTAPTVSMTTMAGNIAAGLTNTTNLTINTGGLFNVGSSAVLNNLTVTADGTFAGAGAGSMVAAGDGAQLLTYVTTGSALALGLQSSASNSYRYTESSASISDIAITSTGTFSPSGGTVNVSAQLANITTPSLMLGSASLVLSTGGDITLTSLASAGGAVNVFSGAGTINLTSVSTSGGSVIARTAGDDARHVNVQDVTTLGGSVSLTADNGSIVRAGALPLQIDTRNNLTQASGNITLIAANGSVGTGAAPILTSGAVTLNVNGMDEIAVDATNTAVTNLNITTSASGAGAVAVTNSNYAGLSLTRVGGLDLNLAALAPTVAGAFSLTATDGNIRVLGDIGNLTSLGLNAGNGFNSIGDLRIQAGTGPRSVVAGSYDLRAGQDVLISSGATEADTVSISQTRTFVNNTVIAGRDILLTANGGAAAVSQGISTATQTVSAGRDLRVSGGSIANATAAITSNGAQSLTAANDLVVSAGSADGASARIVATQSQNFGNVTNLSVLGGGANAHAQLSGSSQSLTQLFGTVTVQGGTGANASAEMVATTGSQSLGNTVSFITTDQVLVQGGAGADAYASIRAATSSQNLVSSQDIQVIGGTGMGSYAELRAGTSQSIGSTTTFNNFNSFDPTDNILVQAGSGGVARILAGGSQTILAGEAISVLGGTGTGMSATIESTGGGQTIGNSGTFRNDPAHNILVQGGTGDDSIAAIRATGFQTINTGGTISVLGNSGVGASAEIRSSSSSGGQNIGSTSTSSNQATESILVQAGTGGIARILAHGSQTIMTGGDLSVLGGPSVGMTASIESTNGFQRIGDTSSFRNNPSDSILVQAGTGDGSAAFINAATGQTIDAGGTIAVRGSSGANAYAEIATSAGTQTIGNVNFNRDRTDAISLAGGSAAGSYARIATSGFQTLSTSSDLSLAGGTGDNSGALLLADTGQNLTVQGSLSMLGGSASAPGLNETAISNNISGTQSINVSGNMSVTGGGFGSDTWIRQNGNGNQSITVSGNLALLAPASTPSTGVTSIESLGPNQNLFVGGALSIDNQAGWWTYIASAGTQTIDADTIAISLSTGAPVSNPFAGITASGDQTIRLHGDGTTPESATLSIANTSSLVGSLAAVSTAANQVILMDYDTAGLVQIGSTTGLGATEISAGGDLTMVAGQLLLQGGATAGSDARLLSGDQPPAALTGTMLISTLYGPVQLQGGAGGGAFIDPLLLSVVSNGSVLMQAGANAGSDVNINAGTFDLAATQGDVSLINSTTSIATASITAETFNLFGSGNLNLTGGTITVTQAGTITINGICFGCDTNLFGPFTVSAFIPPPLDFGAFATGNVLALADLGIGLFDAFVDEDGNLVLSNRRLNQCY